MRSVPYDRSPNTKDDGSREPPYDRARKRAQQIEDLKEDLKTWSPVILIVAGIGILIGGTFVSITCTRYGPGENGCIEYGNDPIGRALTAAGLLSVLLGLYIIFTPYLGWPLVPRKG